MNEDVLYTIIITVGYSIIVFIDENLKPKKRANLTSVLSWIGALVNSLLDLGFSVFTLFAIGYFTPQIPVNLSIGASVISGIYLREKIVSTIGERISKWKI